MNKKMSKRQKEIKSKLMAAICMLLVSSIMMVSSTYAWFTLSTAPEVTGITTAVGANGNLEMALLPTSGSTDDITSAVGDSYDHTQDYKASNVTWGNLVKLDEGYGLDKITLYPSALNIIGDTLQAALLQTPTYGADGRVNELAKNTLTGIYAANEAGTMAFNPDTAGTTTYGVRAVGTASGMTDRQLDYRNARSAANTARSQAASAAASALNANGSALANVAIKYGMDGTDAKFTNADLVPLRALINALQGTSNSDGVLDYIEDAYLQYILAYGASKAGGGETDDVKYLAVKGLVEADNATLASVTEALSGQGVTLDSTVQDYIADYQTMVTSVTAADTKLKSLEADVDSGKTEFSWDEIKDAMTPLVDPAAMEINGFKASEVRQKLGDLVSSVTAQGGLTVTMKTGAGLFASIADHTEDYTASVTIDEVTYENITLKNMTARMETKTSHNPTFLVALGNVVQAAGAPESGAQGTMPITDMYGYVIDLAFKTNAAESNLLLQQEAKDRIYSDNTNEETMGHGATMTFKATTTDFSNDQVKELMKAIRIVFFDPGTSKVINYAKLDVDNATSGTDGWTAEIMLYTISEGGDPTYTEATYAANSGKTYYQKSTESEDSYTAIDDATASQASDQLYTLTDGTYSEATYAADSGLTYYTKSTVQKTVYTAVDDTTAASAEEGTLYTQDESTAGQEVEKTDNVIMPLTQNTATRLSVLVYLDGNKVTNEDVAATAATSMTGSMNLQFSSSATLVPMDYADLHTPGASESQGS